MKPTTIALALSVPFFFAACENPADKTSKASVKEAVENTQTVSEGGTKYVFAEGSEVTFVGSKVTGSHKGGFKTVSGHFTVKDGALAGNDHAVKIDMNSIWSDDEKLTGHLKNADFFDVEKFPESTFAATSLTKKSDTEYEVAGNFTLHGVTKNISFPATTATEGDTVKVTANFNINRKDFGVVYAGMPDNLIRDEVVIGLNLVVKPGA